jgi:hypothetical protein
LGAVSLLALEGGEVVTVRTHDTAGRTRDTRTWIADEAGGAWVEAASPERPFLHDVMADPSLDLWRGGRWQHCRAAVAQNPEGHARIRRLLADKYGWKDCWIGMLADTNRSLGLRLDCEDA